MTSHQTIEHPSLILSSLASHKIMLWLAAPETSCEHYSA